MCRAFELRLELALKSAHAHIRQQRETIHVVDLPVILKYEILEIIAIADNGLQQRVKILRGVILPKKDTQLLLLDLVEMKAVKSSVEVMVKI